MKVWLDDERPAPKGWIHVTTATDAITTLEAGGVTEISLDHDLGSDPEAGNGYLVLLHIEEQVVCYGAKPPVIHIHTSNPSARRKMEKAVEHIYSCRMPDFPNR